MGSRGSKPPSLTWKDLEIYAESENLTPLDVGKLIHNSTKPELKTKVETFLMLGTIHRLLETVKPLINSETVWKPHALLLLGDYFASKHEYLSMTWTLIPRSSLNFMGGVFSRYFGKTL